MGSWHQDLVVKNTLDKDLDNIINLVLQFLLNSKIIKKKNFDNFLNTDSEYLPGENWHFAVENPEENHFLQLSDNYLEVRKGRTVFWKDGSDFEKIECPNCKENNIECDWGELFSKWIENPNNADLKCSSCNMLNSISEYKFEPFWQLSNLGFVFWNWPILKNSFIKKMEELIQKKN